MSLDGRPPATVAIDQDQLDARLTRLIQDHNHYKTLLFRYIRRSLTLCTWYIDQDCPSFFRQFERTDKLAGLVLYIRDHALQSFQVVDRTGTSLLAQVDFLLARASLLPAATSTLSGASSPSGSKGLQPVNGALDPASNRIQLYDNGSHMNGNGIGLGNNRLLYLAGEVKEAIRFWREQCLCAQAMEPKIFEMDRISELRYLALTGEGSTIDEKARAVRISCEQSRLVTDDIEPFLDQWLGKLAVVDRPKDEHSPAFGHRPGAAILDTSAGHLHHGLSMDHRSASSHSLGSPAASYSSQHWGQGAS